MYTNIRPPLKAHTVSPTDTSAGNRGDYNKKKHDHMPEIRYKILHFVIIVHSLLYKKTTGSCEK